MVSPRSGHSVDERADTVDRDFDFVAGLQRYVATQAAAM
jgi:hypothetical protein